MKRLHNLILAVAAGSTLAFDVIAQSYPERPIRMIVPWAPGGTADIFARTIAEKLTLSLGQPAIVENRPGASGNTGSDLVAKSKADGHTLLIGTMSTHTMNPALFKSMPFRGLDDFTPIAMTGIATNTMVVHPSVPANTVAELITYLKANPGKLAYASAGMGSNNHVCAALLEQMVGVKMVHVPYKGGAPAVADTVAGQTQLFFTALTQSGPHIRAGKLKILAVTEEQRATMLPEVPTVSETIPGYSMAVWYGMFGPPGMPETLTRRLNEEVNQAMQLPDVRERMTKIGVVPTPLGVAQFQQAARRDYDKWTRVIREMGIVAEP